MAIFDTNLDYTKLIQFTEGSLQIASFVQIRNALIERFKTIYGNDIDVNPASADGQYINAISLLINNILQTVKKGYDNMDPAVATGQYLDTLCSYNNINRLLPTPSVVQLYIYNSGLADVNANHLEFMDKNNTLWIWDNGGVDFTFKAGEYTLITDVKCEKLGAINAPGTNAFYYIGSDGLLVETDDPSKQEWDNPDLYGNSLINGTIFETVNDEGLWVWQYSDAEVGNDLETDEELRARRYMMLGNSSVTILEGLKGNLLNITGIKDVYIFNNSSSSDVTLSSANGYEPIADDTEVKEHGIYIALRYKEGVEIDPKSIAKVIYNKLTPGILTSETYNLGSEEDCYYEIPRTAAQKDIIYWKKCSSVSPYVEINLYCKKEVYDYPLENGSVVNDPHTAISTNEKLIVEKLQKYLTDIKIDDYLTVANIMSIIQQNDIQKSGMSTFFTQNGFIGTANNYQYPMNLSYLKYEDEDFVFEYPDPDQLLGILHIGGTTPLLLKLNATELTLNVGELFDLKAKILPSTAPQGTFTFTSSDEGIVDVNPDGSICELEAASLGTATITVTNGTFTATCVVTVVNEE